jgi:hypothetical protein
LRILRRRRPRRIYSSRQLVCLVPLLSYLLAAFLILGLASLAAPAWAIDGSTPTYERDIKPLLARHCTICHKASNRRLLDVSGGLALDSYDAILAGTARKKVVIPGRLSQSELARRIADPDADRRMPLNEDPLPAKQLKLISRWIAAGTPRGTAVPGSPPKGNSLPLPTGKPSASARPPAAGAANPIRFVRSLEVSLPCDVKLRPGSRDAPAGGPLSVSLRIGPLPPVTSLAFRGDNRLLAVGTYGQVVIWDLHDGRPAGSLVEIPGPVHALAFSRDGRRLAVGGGLPARSGIVRIYSVPDGTQIHDFPGHDDVVFGLALRPDGAQLATASFDQTVRLWDLAGNRPAGVFRGHSDFVYCVAYTADGLAVLTGSKDRTIKRISIRTLNEERTYSGHNEDVLAVAVHPDGKRFVSAGNEPEIRWWSLSGDKPLARRGGHSGPVHQLAYSGDGQRLISASGDRTVRLWNGKTGEPIRQLPAAGDWMYAVAISQDGALAAAGGWDGLVRLWDATSGRLRATLAQPPGSCTTGDPSCQADWFAMTPGGHVAGSPELLKIAQWRAGGVNLPSDTSRALCHHPEMVTQALRGQPARPVSFPPKT